MSVRTEADRRMDNVRQHIQSALQDIMQIAVNECWGYEDYNKQFISDTLVELLRLRDKLGPIRQYDDVCNT